MHSNGIDANLVRWSPFEKGSSLYSLAIQKGKFPRLPLPFKYPKGLSVPEVLPANRNEELNAQIDYEFDYQMILKRFSNAT